MQLLSIPSPVLKVLLAAAISGAGLANASVSLQLSPPVASSGDASTTVSISATNWTAGSALGAYQFDLNYDASIWSPTTISFGSFLGHLDNFQALAFSDDVGPGRLRLSSISLLGLFDPQPLSAIQPTAGTSFALASVLFTAVGQGTGSFRLSNVSLSDEYGAPVAAVPEPDTWAMLGLGLGALAIIGRRKVRKGQSASALQPA